MANVDHSTVNAFDDKWATRWRGSVDSAHHRRMFDAFFSLFPLDELRDREGFDLGCGVGRHAEMIAPSVRKLHCIDPSPNAIMRARAALAEHSNVEFHLAGVDEIPLADVSQDFGFSMGVLHHVPNPEDGLRKCVNKLKPGAPFLLYLYYRFENRPAWFRAIWLMSDLARRLIFRLPRSARKTACNAIAVGVYWPLSRLALAFEQMGTDIQNFPLSFYRRSPLVSLKVSALDRFGTPLERRFTRSEIYSMMRRSGLEKIEFQDRAPYWVALGYRTEPRSDEKGL